MSIDIKAEVKFSRVREGEYLVRLQDADKTIIGKVRDGRIDGWDSFNLDGVRTGHGVTRYDAARGLLKHYELANGLRDSEGRRVTKELETGLWFVANHSGARESSRWTDKAEAIAHLASLQVPTQSEPTTPAIDVERVIQIAVEDADKIALTGNGETRTSLRRYRLARLFGNYTLRQLMNANSPQERNDERSRLGRPLRKDDFVNLLVSKALRSLDTVTESDRVDDELNEQDGLDAWSAPETAIETEAAAEEPEFLRVHHCGTTLQERPAEGWDSEDMAGYTYFCTRCSVYTNTFQRSQLRSEADDQPEEQVAADEEPEFEVAVTPVMVWPHGMVDVGKDKLKQVLEQIAYGGGDPDGDLMPGLYVTQGGGLEKATTRLLSSTTDEHDWIQQQIGVFAGDADAPVITVGLRIDGRA
jgi:hypothetical protein